MYRVIILLFVLVILCACGKTEEEQPPAQAQDTPGRPMIDDSEFGEFDRLANALLRPYFDETGADTVLEVAPGEYFDLYIFSEYNELYPMSAAEYKLVLPPEVSVMGTVTTDSTILTLGRYDVDFMIAFRCMQGPKNWIVKYSCKAHEEFEGGMIETIRGQNMDFLGFTMCDGAHTLIRGRGGKAELKKK